MGTISLKLVSLCGLCSPEVGWSLKGKISAQCWVALVMGLQLRAPQPLEVGVNGQENGLIVLATQALSPLLSEKRRTDTFLLFSSLLFGFTKASGSTFLGCGSLLTLCLDDLNSLKKGDDALNNIARGGATDFNRSSALLLPKGVQERYSQFHTS